MLTTRSQITTNNDRRSTDNGLRTSSNHWQLPEPLESRLLLATITNGALLIDGTPGPDVISVDVTATHYRVTVNNQTQSFKKPRVFRFRIRSLGGSDRITLASAISQNARIDAGGGHDTVFAAAGDDTITGGSGNDRLNAGSGDDEILGGAGDDLLRGAGGADSLEGNDGDDRLFGDAGNDFLIGDSDGALAAGADLLSGGTGADWAIYTRRTGPLNLSLDGKPNDGTATEKDNLGTDIENLAGGDGDDTITGSDAPNYLIGNAGNDYVLAGAGNDRIDGLAGNDTVYAGDGNDTMVSGGGNDSLHGQNGDDVFFTRDLIQTFLDGGPGTDWSMHDLGLDRVRFVELRG